MGSSCIPNMRVAAEEVRKSIEWMAHIGHLMRERGSERDKMLLEIVDHVLNSLTVAGEALRWGEDGQQPDEKARESVWTPVSDCSEVGGSKPRGKEKGSGGAAAKKGGARRRSHPYSRTTSSSTLNDGYPWRKYGQKGIHSTLYPRSYYRCTHKFSKGCMATRLVQPRDEDQSIYNIIYIGHHTCMAPSSQAKPQPALSPDPQSELTVLSETKMEDCEATDQASVHMDDSFWAELDMLTPMTAMRNSDESVELLYGIEDFGMWEPYDITSSFLAYEANEDRKCS